MVFVVFTEVQRLKNPAKHHLEIHLRRSKSRKSASEQLEKKLDAATGYLSIRLNEDAWDELELISPELRARESVIEPRVEILLELERWEFARSLAESQA